MLPKGNLGKSPQDVTKTNEDKRVNKQVDPERWVAGCLQRLLLWQVTGVSG